MAVLSKTLGRRRDLPQLETAFFAGASAGTGSDFEHAILYLPDLSKVGVSSGMAGLLPVNDLYIRSFGIVTEANLTGAATNNMLLGFRQYRAGAVVNQISTQNTGAITAGSGVVVTPVTGTLMTNIAVGTVLHFAAGGGTAEDVIVTAVTATTFTATFGFNHNANTACTGVYLASRWYNAGGVTETLWTPRQFTPIPNQVLPGDVITIQRSSYGTGLASPALSIMIEWVSLSNNQPLG